MWKGKQIMDIRHFCMEKGTGEALILLHGNGEDSGHFKYQMEEFSSDYRVIALDTRGHGRTPRGDAPFTIRQFAEDLAAFMDRLDINSAHILGFSDGANIAMCFAAKYPHRVKKLILNGGNLNTKGVKASTQIPIELGYRIAKLFSSKSAQAKKNTEILSLMINQPNISVQELRQITAETLVIAGTKDMIKEKHTRFIANHIKNSRLCFIDGDHFITSKNPAAFNHAVSKFLKINIDSAKSQL